MLTNFEFVKNFNEFKEKYYSKIIVNSANIVDKYILIFLMIKETFNETVDEAN